MINKIYKIIYSFYIISRFRNHPVKFSLDAECFSTYQLPISYGVVLHIQLIDHLFVFSRLYGYPFVG
jgi:hypothetical protein